MNDNIDDSLCIQPMQVEPNLLIEGLISRSGSNWECLVNIDTGDGYVSSGKP